MSTSDLIFYNTADGYAEAILRGFRKGILSKKVYQDLSRTNELKVFKSVRNIKINLLLIKIFILFLINLLKIFFIFILIILGSYGYRLQ